MIAETMRRLALGLGIVASLLVPNINTSAITTTIPHGPLQPVTSKQAQVTPEPVLISPPDGSTTPDITPVFSWNEVTNATRYQVQVANNSNFSNLILKPGPTEILTYSPTTVLTAGTYYWHVRAYVGQWGEYSSAWTFTVNGAPPPPPTLLLPSDGSTTLDITPDFDWSDVTGADHYRIQINNTTDFTDPAVESDPEDSDYTPTEALLAGTYYWRVRTNDGMKNWGEYTSISMFIVNGAPPPPPDLLSPSDGSTTPDITPPFDWSDVTGADRYRIQVANNIDFSKPVLDSEPTDSDYTPGKALPNGTYYWHVRTNDGMGNWSDYSMAWTLTVNGAPPPVPALIAPADGSTMPDVTPPFDWSDVPGAHHYHIQIDDNADFASPAAESEPTASTYTPSNPLPNGIYFWHVRTNDGMGNWGEDSPAWRVTISGMLPPTPMLIAPADGSTTPDFTPAFDWYDVPGADHYRIQIDDNADFSSLLADSQPIASTYSPGNQLPNGTYYWRVRAADTMGNWGTYSPTWRVVVNGALAPAPTLIAPPDGSTTADFTPAFDWVDVSGADYYRIQIDDNADFSSPLADSEPEASAYTPGNQLLSGTYFWHVRSRDGMGNWGSYSPAWRLIVSGTLPPAPMLIEPPDGSATPDLTPDFDWVDVSGADHYRIQIDDNADFSSPLVDTDPVASAYTPGSRLPNGAFYWRVRTNDGMGNWGDYSLAWRVTVSGVLPPVPALIAPADGSTTPDFTPSFDWSDVPGADHYRIQIDDNADFSSPLADSEPAASAYAPGSPLPSGTYFWHVRTNDGLGNWGEYSAAWRVSVNGALPPVPTLMAPADGSTSPDLTPLFDWDDVPGAHHYRIQIDDNADFSSLLADAQPNRSSYTPRTRLAAGAYYWRVRAADSMNNWGDYSSIWRVMIATTPSKPPAPTAAPLSPVTPTPIPILNDNPDTPSLPVPASTTVYLTFDDGPDPSYTPQLVAYLHQRGIQATFFLTGSSHNGAGGDLYFTCAAEPGDLVPIDALDGRRIVEVIDTGGFAIGLHGWFHGSIIYPQDLWSAAGFDIRANIAQEENALAIQGISFDPLLRAPGGAFPTRPFPVYQDWFYYGWDIDAGDDYGASPQAIIDRVRDGLSGTPDNPIILLHAGRPNTLQAIVDPRFDLIGKIMALGYTRFDRLPRPIDHTGYPPNGATYTLGP